MSTTTYRREDLLRPRSVVRTAWDLAGIPFRFVLFPDHWNQRCGWTSFEEERLRAVLPEIKGRLLDVGAGTNTLVKLYGEGVGVDVFDFGGGATIVEDTRSLPFADESFDTVTFVACLNHIPYRLEALQEAWRVLKPGGTLVATMINRALGEVGHKLWWYSEDKVRGMLPGETGGLNVTEMQQLLHDAGYTEIRVRRFVYGLNGLFLGSKPETAAAAQRRAA